jgi:cytochrome bd-type quinol oxidase subunit 2
MKVLVKDKIIESYHFPLTEALSFSILVWTTWGLAEAFYWNKIYPFFDNDMVRLSPHIYIASFFLYLLIAAIVAILVYGIVRWVSFTMGQQEDQAFRSATLAGILGIFFLAIMYHASQHYLSGTDFSRTWRYGITVFIILFTALLTYLLYHTASRLGFRLRRSGTMMLSILVISILLSFVRFPMFSHDQENTLDLRESIKKLMAYQYLSPERSE